MEDEAAALEEEIGDLGLQEGTDFFNMIEGVGFLEVKKNGRKTCDRNKAYLDTCCTNHSCFAAEYMRNIQKTGVMLKQHCNAGTSMTGRARFWRNLRFWYNEEGIANLISAPQLESEGYMLEYATELGWLAHGPDGKTMMFKKDKGLCGGIPYIDLTDDGAGYIMDTSTIRKEDGVVMVQTVRGNYEGYTREEVENARKAREAQAMMAHPLDEMLKHLVNAVKNIDISAPAIANAKTLFGPDLGGVRGKMVRQRPSAVRPEYVDIPRALFKRIRDVTLTADVMFVNGLSFLVTLSWGIKLGSIKFLPSRTAKQLTIALGIVVLIYR